MFPSLNPHSRSRSSGVTTCRCRMMSLIFGAYWAMVLTTLSPNFSFSVSQSRPGASLYGAYCTKQERICLPGGASDVSVRVGITMSMYGWDDQCPYFPSSYAFSMYSTLGEIAVAPRRCAPTPGMHLKFGNPSSAMFTLPDDPRNL